jgi:hypothetical protein
VGKHDAGLVSITNCYSTGNVSGFYEIGGLVGYNHGYIANCYSTGSVSGGSIVGGLVGKNQRRDITGTITNCYSNGDVTGDDDVGGLVGFNYGTITICYSTGTVSGDNDDIGGLVGRNNGTINNCYSAGSITGNGSVDGLVGDNRFGNVTDSFWDIDTSGQTTSDGGTGKTTAEMQTMSTFTDAGWDFVGETANGTDDIWRLCEALANYPHLNWQFPLGDFLCPDGVDFIDYSFFASHWLEDNCCASNDCEGTDLDQLGTVDIYDLVIGLQVPHHLPRQAIRIH